MRAGRSFSRFWGAYADELGRAFARGTAMAFGLIMAAVAIRLLG